jgi:hypothetical protein
MNKHNFTKCEKIMDPNICIKQLPSNRCFLNWRQYCKTNQIYNDDSISTLNFFSQLANIDKIHINKDSFGKDIKMFEKYLPSNLSKKNLINELRIRGIAASKKERVTYLREKLRANLDEHLNKYLNTEIHKNLLILLVKDLINDPYYNRYLPVSLLQKETIRDWQSKSSENLLEILVRIKKGYEEINQNIIYPKKIIPKYYNYKVDTGVLFTEYIGIGDIVFDTGAILKYSNKHLVKKSTGTAASELLDIPNELIINNKYITLGDYCNNMTLYQVDGLIDSIRFLKEIYPNDALKIIKVHNDYDIVLGTLNKLRNKIIDENFGEGNVIDVGDATDEEVEQLFDWMDQLQKKTTTKANSWKGLMFGLMSSRKPSDIVKLLNNAAEVRNVDTDDEGYDSDDFTDIRDNDMNNLSNVPNNMNDILKLAPENYEKVNLKDEPDYITCTSPTLKSDSIVKFKENCEGISRCILDYNYKKREHSAELPWNHYWNNKYYECRLRKEYMTNFIKTLAVTMSELNDPADKISEIKIDEILEYLVSLRHLKSSILELPFEIKLSYVVTIYFFYIELNLNSGGTGTNFYFNKTFRTKLENVLQSNTISYDQKQNIILKMLGRLLDTHQRNKLKNWGKILGLVLGAIVVTGVVTLVTLNKLESQSKEIEKDRLDKIVFNKHLKKESLIEQRELLLKQSTTDDNNNKISELDQKISRIELDIARLDIDIENLANWDNTALNIISGEGIPRKQIVPSLMEANYLSKQNSEMIIRREAFLNKIEENNRTNNETENTDLRKIVSDLETKIIANKPKISYLRDSNFDMSDVTFNTVAGPLGLKINTGTNEETAEGKGNGNICETDNSKDMCSASKDIQLDRTNMPQEITKNHFKEAGIQVVSGEIDPSQLKPSQTQIYSKKVNNNLAHIQCAANKDCMSQEGTGKFNTVKYNNKDGEKIKASKGHVGIFTYPENFTKGSKPITDENPAKAGGTGRTLITKDGHILDGHHRWATYTACRANPNLCPGHDVSSMPVDIVDLTIQEAIAFANEGIGESDWAGINKAVDPNTGQEEEMPSQGRIINDLTIKDEWSDAQKKNAIDVQNLAKRMKSNKWQPLSISNDKSIPGKAINPNKTINTNDTLIFSHAIFKKNFDLYQHFKKVVPELNINFKQILEKNEEYLAKELDIDINFFKKTILTSKNGVVISGSNAIFPIKFKYTIIGVDETYSLLNSFCAEIITQSLIYDYKKLKYHTKRFIKENVNLDKKIKNTLVASVNKSDIKNKKCICAPDLAKIALGNLYKTKCITAMAAGGNIYKYITNPETGKKANISSKLGKHLLKLYIDQIKNNDR